MKLFIQADDGTLELVTDELGAYDLSKTMARLDLTDEIKDAIRRVKVHNDMNRPNTDEAVNRVLGE